MIGVRDLHMNFARRPDIVERAAQAVGLAASSPPLKALDGIDLTVQTGEVVALVGESGCGKSTLGRILSGLQTQSSGEIIHKHRPVSEMSPAEYRAYMLAVQMIFQDALSSLNPRRRVVDLIGEAPVVHKFVTASQMDDYVCEIMAKVGLDPSLRTRFPHQFSGGQRMRISIARALAVQPEILVCDEVTASLDVSIQAQIINFFLDLRRQQDLTYIFVSHDLSVVRLVADRVAVMYLGRIVEIAEAERLFAAPAHPYTQALLADAPSLSPVKRRFAALKGELPSPINPPDGCHFHPRCSFAGPRCRTRRPPLVEVAPAQFAACYLHEAGGVEG